jgi:large subunit ribosomal protein L34
VFCSSTTPGTPIAYSIRTNLQIKPTGRERMFGARCVCSALGVAGHSLFRSAPRIQSRYWSQPASNLHTRSNPRNRTFSALSRLPTRPQISSARTTMETTLSSPSIEASTTPTACASLTLVRGAKRDTFNPSHRKRKRRLGFLARLKDRHGRKILERRRAKGRSTLSH